LVGLILSLIWKSTWIDPSLDHGFRILICMQNNPIQSNLIRSKIICVLRDSNSRASALHRHIALLTTELFCHDTGSLWHKYIAWFLRRQRTCQMKTRNKFCCVCTTGACVNNFLKFPSQIYICVCSCGASLPSTLAFVHVDLHMHCQSPINWNFISNPR
jgi:hypothetical protein